MLSALSQSAKHIISATTEEYVQGMTRRRFESLLDVDRDQNKNLSNANQVSNSSDASVEPAFHRELVLAHCFQQFKRKDSQLPQSRRRIFVLPQKEDALGVPARPPPPAPPETISCYEEILKATQEQPEDVSTWVRRRMQLRQDLETFGDLDKWLQNKNDITALEAKVLHGMYLEQETWLKGRQAVTVQKKRPPRPGPRAMPQLLLPMPPVLPNLFSFLHFHKLRLPDIFRGKELRSSWKISREEFILALREVGVPLNQEEMEDVVIYLSSLNKNNTITMNNLEVCHKQWVVSQRKSVLLTWREYYRSARQKNLKAKVSKGPSPMVMDWLTVPAVDIKPESFPMSQEEREEVSKQYRERRKKAKVPPNPPGGAGEGLGWLTHAPTRKKHLGRDTRDSNLPSTMGGEMKDFLNHFRRENFLVYLQCCKACEYYGIQLTKDILVKALLYPGDRVIFQKDHKHRIRQPGGYYSDQLFGQKYSGSKKRDQLTGTKGKGSSTDVCVCTRTCVHVGISHSSRTLSPAAMGIGSILLLGLRDQRKAAQKVKQMPFPEFEDFLRSVESKTSESLQRTDPNAFWPGQLLDKLQLYLPTMSRDRSLALFSCVRPQPPAYPAIYHPDRWWPIKNTNYVTYANYDANKVYFIG
ncbi:EF-hand calcium-binding domain-containing protein 12 [Sorex fumeus]|uniref:EF-hand calcium-binding domain-containing protein 12 n=1 Tax=Sorex fumeus TaxID=62283 RepID=UPI0024AD5D6A|nr:EF-hand calcium-binding domain-containing protein 12 [Sorex fumeus]